MDLLPGKDRWCHEKKRTDRRMFLCVCLPDRRSLPAAPGTMNAKELSALLGKPGLRTE